MLRLSARRLAAAGRGCRTISATPSPQDDLADSGPQAFLKEFGPKVSSTLAPPNFPSDFYKKKDKQEEGAALPDKLTFNLYLPHAQHSKQAKVDLVLLPAVTGDFGVMPGHVPTVAQLRPGVVTIHKELDKDVEKLFVSSGFAFVHPDSSADVCAVEAVKVEELDPEAVRAGLQEYTGKLGALQGKADDYEIAAAQIGVEVYSAMNAAIGA